MYPKWAKMVTNMQTIQTPLLNTHTRNNLVAIAKKRFAEVTSCHVLLVAAALDPEYMKQKDIFEEEPTGDVMRGVDGFFERWAKDDVQLANDLSEELAAFRLGDRGIDSAMHVDFMQRKPAFQFWNSKGYLFPKLRVVAMRLLAQQASSSASERVNSEMGWLMDDKSNSLSQAYLENITWVHHNLRLLNDIDDPEYEDVNILWDELVEEADSDEE